MNLKIANTIRYYKQHGLISFLKRMFSSFGFEFFTHTVIFIVMDLNEMQDDGEEPCSLYEATFADVQQTEDYNDGWFTKKEALHRLQNDRRLFNLRKNEINIYYHWAETKEVTINWLDLDFSIPKNMVYTAGLYIIPEMRGQGHALRLCKKLSLFLKKQRFDKQIGAIEFSNARSLHINKKIGFKEYQTVTYTRYGYLRYYKVQKSNSTECKTFTTLFKAPKNIWKTYL